jgi:hypothetical protein
MPLHVSGAIQRRVSLRDQWFFECQCSRCQDPTENGSFATSVACPECKSDDAKMSLMLPRDHQILDSVWQCEIKNHVLTSNQVSDIESDYVKKWMLEDQTSIECIENFIRKTDTLSPSHHFVMKVKGHLMAMYSTERGPSQTDPATLKRRQTICKELIRYLCKVDPGKTRKMGVFLLEYNKPTMKLAKIDLDEGRISRIEFFKQVREGAKLEAMAKDMLGAYTTVSVRALKDLLNNKK